MVFTNLFFKSGVFGVGREYRFKRNRSFVYSVWDVIGIAIRDSPAKMIDKLNNFEVGSMTIGTIDIGIWM